MLKYIHSQGVDLTPEQWIVLNWLWSHRSACQQELAEATQKNKTSITRLIDGLVKRNYVKRVPDANDRRKHLLEMTPSAIEMMDKIMPHVLGEYQKVIQDLSPEEVQTLKSILGKIVSRVQELDHPNP